MNIFFNLNILSNNISPKAIKKQAGVAHVIPFTPLN
jgi:hypothetical protein